MYLAANTFVHEVARVSLKQTLQSVQRFGFRYVDFASYRLVDPSVMSRPALREFVRAFKDHGFVSSQLIMVNTQHMASPDPAKRSRAIDYMKACGELQRELGGKQVLVCWGCGVLEPTVSREQSWLNTVSSLRAFGEWALEAGVLVGLELDPHVYFVLNSLEKMAKVLEDVDLPNVYPNVDIGHLCITREPPKTLAKIRDRIYHVHLSETDTFAHTNSIIGSGSADFKAYVDKVEELGIEENCRRIGEVPVAGIEMGEPGGEVDDPDRWIRESLEYLRRVLPGLRLE
jgi:sugar phosphate isomerase/epimerase